MINSFSVSFTAETVLMTANCFPQVCLIHLRAIDQMLAYNFAYNFLFGRFSAFNLLRIRRHSNLWVSFDENPSNGLRLSEFHMDPTSLICIL